MKLIIDIDADILAKLTEYGEPLPAGNSFYDSILSAVANGEPYEERLKGNIRKKIYGDGYQDGHKDGYDKGYADTQALYKILTNQRIDEIIEELESRKDYGPEYAQAMEDAIVVLKAMLGIDKETKNE